MSPAESGSAAAHSPASESKSKIEIRSPLDHCWCLHTVQCTEGCRSQVPFNMDSIDKNSMKYTCIQCFFWQERRGEPKFEHSKGLQSSLSWWEKLHIIYNTFQLMTPLWYEIMMSTLGWYIYMYICVWGPWLSHLNESSCFPWPQPTDKGQHVRSMRMLQDKVDVHSNVIHTAYQLYLQIQL